MAIYSIVSLKGGVGKTMTAMHVAACLAHDEDSPPVVVYDADEERSACRWAHFFDGEGPFEVVPAERDRLAQQVRASANEGHQVVIDTPPNNREILMRAGMLGAHIIVPVPPTGMDIDRMTPTLEMLRDVEATKGEFDVAILFTQWVRGTILAREADDALKDFPVLKTRIRLLQRYKRAFGTIPTYLSEYQEALEELHHG